MGLLAKVFLRIFCGKFCGKFSEIRFTASGKSAEILQKVRGNFADNFCNDPFPSESPTPYYDIMISELLIKTRQKGHKSYQFESQMWVWPQLPLGGHPQSPIATGEPNAPGGGGPAWS